MSAQRSVPAFLEHLRKIFAWDDFAAADEAPPQQDPPPDSCPAGAGGSGKKRGNV